MIWLLMAPAVGLAAAPPVRARAPADPAPPGSAAAPRLEESATAVTGELLVRFRHEVRAAERTAIASARGARALHHFAFIDVDHLRVPGNVDSAIAALRADPRVLYAEPNYELHVARSPDDPLYPEQYGLHNEGQTGGTPGADIGAPHAWDVFTGDSTLKIGMIDTGIDYTHPDLAANVWTNPGEIPGNGIDDDGNGYVDDVHGYDFVNDDGDPMDDNGHGTHTAGIVAAVGNDGRGVSGVTWRAQLVGIKFLNSLGSGSVAGAISAVQYAMTVGCRLTNNSWGGGGFSQALLDAINAAGQAGELFVAAAGNAGRDLDGIPFYPATFDTPYLISVAATDDRDSLAAFSNYGPNSVDIAAPGVDILSTFPDNRYALLSGTSMACPMVAGVAALVYGQFPQLDAAGVRSALMTGADRVPALSGLVRSGRLNAFNAVATPDSVPPGAITDLAVGEVGSNTVELSWTATGDDSSSGRASSYDLRWSAAPLTPENFALASRAGSPPVPQVAGSRERAVVTGLPFSTTLYLGVRALDEFANAGPVSNIVTASTLGVPRLALAPDSVKAQAATGAADSATVTLTNAGEGTLDFEVAGPVIAYAAPAQHPAIPAVKGKAGMAGPPVGVHAGGPDGFGYRWIDSDTTAGPAFQWIDVTALGSRIELSGDDRLSAPVALGFRFPFYGTNFDSVKVCTNGFLTFTDSSPFYANQPLPSGVAPANAIMPLWDDLIFGSEHLAWAWGDSSRFVIEYAGVSHYSSGGPYTFEVVLSASGEIRFQYLKLAPPTTSATVGLQDGGRVDGLQVAFDAAYLHDSLAVKLVPIGQWATVAPAAGRVVAGATAALTVRFDAAGLAGGDYRADLRVATNDPTAALSHVPLRLHVVGAPDLRLSPASLDFGDVYVGSSAARALTVSNPGTDVLRVGPLSVSDSTLVPDATTFSLERFERRRVQVSWTPAAVGTLAAVLNVPSNDLNTPLVQVPLTGRAVPAPSVSASPDTLVATLDTGASITQPLHVMNRGAGDYVFRAVPLPGAGGFAARVDTVPPSRVKGARDLRHGAAAQQAGGPDNFGYTYRDSREPGGPQFRWEDVRGRGGAIPLTGDDALSGPLPLGFDFPFYDQSFRTLRVCTNGFVTLSDSITGFSNTPLPSQAYGVPADLLAVLWDDLVFPPGVGAWFFADAGHAVVQFQDVPRFGEPAQPNTFEIALDASGTIEYRYLRLTATDRASATVGIQNAARDDGLQVAFNTPYLADSLSVRITRPPGWLTVTPDTGRIAPGAAADLAVTFHAADLAGGAYRGAVSLDGNDPLRPHLAVPAGMQVIGVPALVCDPGALDFGTVSVGEERTLPLRVVNAGSDTLRVPKLSSPDARFTAVPEHFVIEPFASRDVDITFTPDGVGTVSASLTARSNDPAQPVRDIALAARGAEPPRAALSQTGVRAALAPELNARAGSEAARVVVRNLGGNDLRYRATAHPGPGASAPRPVEQEAPKEAPAPPGALGAGGPDAFGYRWTDSDQPGSPAFDWIDARRDGRRLALTGDDQTSGPVAIGFPFSFYGARFDSIRVCTNGFASFTSTLASYTNTPLPNTGAVAPANLLAVFWDDQDFRSASGAGEAWVSGDSSRCVIAYYDVPHLTVGGPYTYEVVLHRDGTIDYQYLTMTSRLTEATIGIQNGDGSSGLQVAYNAAYVHDHLRVHFTTTPPWLTVAPDSGRVVPGGADTLLVKFSAAGYPAGDYDGVVRIDDNELRGGVHDLPARLHIGGAHATARLATALAVTAAVRTAVVNVSVPGTDARAIDPATVRVNDSLAVAADSAASTAAAAALRVDVLGLLRSAGGADRVPLEVVGEIPGQTWFSALDTVRLTRPVLTAPATLRPLGSGGARVDVPSAGIVNLAWRSPPGVPSERWDVWFSPDGGASWNALALSQLDRELRWSPPALADSALIEIIGRGGSGESAAFISDPFRFLPPDSLNGGQPVSFALRLRSGNPVRDAAVLELALPGGGDVNVTVHDVTGARVRTLANASHPAGYVPLSWDLLDGSGRAVPPGIYFVHASSQGRSAVVRLAVLR
jgi:subtilisin family serine protease